MRTDPAGFCDQILSGSINGIYQGMILTGLVALVFSMMRRKTNAATRHAILFFTLLLLAGLMLAHWGRALAMMRNVSPSKLASRGHFQQQQNLNYTLNTTPLETESESLAETSSVHQSKILATADIDSTVRWSSERVENSFDTKILSPALEENGQVGFNPFQNKLPESLRFVASGLINPVSVGFQIPKKFSVILLAVWIVAVASKLLILLLHLINIRSLKANSALPDRELRLIFDRLCQTTRTRRKVQLRVSRTYKSPLLLGFLHPVILLPAQNKEHPEVAELEQVLRHELAHVRRYDDWANLLQHLLQAILFFHPGVWWISKRLTLEREIACDDQVLEQSERRAYALLLVDLARRMQGYHPTLAQGTFSNKNQLKERIDMVLDAYRNSSPHLGKTRMGVVTAVLFLFAAGAIWCAPRVVLAQNDAAPLPAGHPPAPAQPFRAPKDQLSPPPAPRNPGEPFSVAQNQYPVPPGERPALGDLPAVPGPQPVNPPGPRGPMMRNMPPSDRALEQRLARVERMLEMLMSHFDINPGEAQFRAKGPADVQGMREQMQFEKRLHEQNSREFEDAVRQLKQAYDSAPRDGQGRSQASKSFKQEVERLSQARTQDQLLKLQQDLEMLEREKDKVGQAIDRLQKEQKQREAEAKKSDDKE